MLSGYTETNSVFNRTTVVLLLKTLITNTASRFFSPGIKRFKIINNSTLIHNFNRTVLNKLIIA
jgi:hypothetical protein